MFAVRTTQMQSAVYNAHMQKILIIEDDGNLIYSF